MFSPEENFIVNDKRGHAKDPLGQQLILQEIMACSSSALGIIDKARALNTRVQQGCIENIKVFNIAIALPKSVKHIRHKVF